MKSLDWAHILIATLMIVKRLSLRIHPQIRRGNR
jgi:hypothetical protein